MKKEEDEKVIKILLECDGGYEYYVSSLLSLFGDKNKFGTEIEDFLNPSHKEHRR